MTDNSHTHWHKAKAPELYYEAALWVYSGELDSKTGRIDVSSSNRVVDIDYDDVSPEVSQLLTTTVHLFGRRRLQLAERVALRLATEIIKGVLRR